MSIGHNNTIQRLMRPVYFIFTFLTHFFAIKFIHDHLNLKLRVYLLKLFMTFIFFMAFSNNSLAKQISISFDDAPRVADGHLTGEQRMRGITQALYKHGVKAAFYVNSAKMDNDEALSRVVFYARSGHILANHTHSHFNFNNTDLKTYKDDFREAHNRLHRFINYKKWFRFPYLREGNTQEKVNGFRQYLGSYGYKNAYITINNYDWYMETLFQNYAKTTSQVDLNKLRNFYVEELYGAIEYYYQMGKEVSKRPIKHVLLLHENDLAALFLDDLLQKLKKNNWRFITPEQAYDNNFLANYKTKKIWPNNPGRLAEYAVTKGMTTGLWHKSCSEPYLEKQFQKALTKVPESQW